MKTILFDFDGTIADTLPVIFTSFRSTFQRFLGKSYTDQDIINLFGPAEIAMLQSQIPVDLHEQAIEHFFQQYTDHHRTMQNPPPMLAMLDTLQEAGMQLGIVTGKGRRSADISLEQLKLGGYFQVVITGDDVTKPKPDPEGILLAMAQLGASAETTLFVGDSDADVKAAKSASVRSVGVNWLSVSQKTGGFDPQPDFFFTDPEAFARWILTVKL